MCKKDELLEYVIQDIIDMISTDWSIEYDEAKNKFYNSEVFEKLIDEETGLYLESPNYVYDLFKDEMNFWTYYSGGNLKFLFKNASAFTVTIPCRKAPKGAFLVKDEHTM